MSSPARSRYRSRLAITSALVALMTLAACDEKAADPAQYSAFGNVALPPLPEALPMTDASGNLVYAPMAERLPVARQLSYADPGDQGYAWIDRADTVFDTIGDAPPDYGFGYDDVEPWGWEAAGGYTTYAEPVGDESYRYYYYEPGADDPYLVRDPYYSYGYSGGRIAAIYDAGGALLPLALMAQRADYGSRYYARAQNLRRAAQRDRRGVSAPVWAARRPAIVRAQQRWQVARENQPGWREWRQRDAVQAQRQQLRGERQARRQASQRFAGWQQRGLRGDAPNLYARQQRQAERAERAADNMRRTQQVEQRMRGVTEAARRQQEQNSEPPRTVIVSQRRAERAGGQQQVMREQRQAARQAQREARQAQRQTAGQQVGDAARQQQRAVAQAARQQQRAQQQAQRQQTQRPDRAALTEARQQQRAQAQAARQQQMQQRQSQAAVQRRAQADAGRRQQMEQRRAEQGLARQQQVAARQQQMAAQRQQRQAAAGQEQAAQRQQQQAARQQQATQRQQQQVARQQADGARQQQRQAAMAQRQQRQAAREARPEGGGGERRERRQRD